MWGEQGRRQLRYREEGSFFVKASGKPIFVGSEGMLGQGDLGVGETGGVVLGR